MRSMISVLTFTLLTTLCWGVYGPLLSSGHDAMNNSSLRPFICVGIAYCVIAVAVPLLLLRLRGEAGSWTATGTLWSLVAGATVRWCAGRHPGLPLPRQAALRHAADLWRCAGDQHGRHHADGPQLSPGESPVFCRPDRRHHRRRHRAGLSPGAAGTRRRRVAHHGTGRLGGRRRQHRAGRFLLGRLRARAAQRPTGDGREPPAAVRLRRPGLLPDRRARSAGPVGPVARTGQLHLGRLAGAWPAERPAPSAPWASSWPSPLVASRSTSCRSSSAERPSSTPWSA